MDCLNYYELPNSYENIIHEISDTEGKVLICCQSEIYSKLLLYLIDNKYRDVSNMENVVHQNSIKDYLVCLCYPQPYNIDEFNNDDNIDGSKIKLIILSSQMCSYIPMYGIRYVYILNELHTDLLQIIRGVIYDGSHVRFNLPCRIIINVYAKNIKFYKLLISYTYGEIDDTYAGCRHSIILV
jgi:hypothetical protein